MFPIEGTFVLSLTRPQLVLPKDLLHRLHGKRVKDTEGDVQTYGKGRHIERGHKGILQEEEPNTGHSTPSFPVSPS